VTTVDIQAVLIGQV